MINGIIQYKDRIKPKKKVIKKIQKKKKNLANFFIFEKNHFRTNNILRCLKLLLCDF